MIDINLIFDGTPPHTGVAITATAVSTNVIDLGAQKDIGAGWSSGIDVHVDVLTAFTAAGSATLQIQLQGSVDNATFYDLLWSPVLAVANLVIGAKVFRVNVPADSLNNTNKLPSRYLRLNYTVATGPFTAGTVMSYLTGGHDRKDFVAYPNNYSVGA